MTFYLEEREYEVPMARRPFDDCAGYIESEFRNTIMSQPGEEILPGLRRWGAEESQWRTGMGVGGLHREGGSRYGRELEWFLKKHLGGR
ncbi:DUF1894 domain-containing protein [Methanopyrus sp.]